MRTTTFFSFFVFLLFSLFFVASALPEPPNELGLSTRALDDFNNVPDEDDVANLAVAEDDLSPVAGGGGHHGGGGWGCPKGWGKCSKWNKVCCPIGGQCCGYKKCCPKGYYCYTTKWHEIKCCKRGYTCYKRGGGGHN